MGTVWTDDFRMDAVRIALSSKDQKTARETVFPVNGDILKNCPGPQPACAR